MGEVIAFGLPVLRVRRKPTSGFCEVTVLPSQAATDRDPELPPKPSKQRPARKSGRGAHPVGVCLK